MNQFVSSEYGHLRDNGGSCQLLVLEVALPEDLSVDPSHRSQCQPNVSPMGNVIAQE